MANKTTNELTVMGRLERELSVLEPEGRQRALAWLGDRFRNDRFAAMEKQVEQASRQLSLHRPPEGLE